MTHLFPKASKFERRLPLAHALYDFLVYFRLEKATSFWKSFIRKLSTITQFLSSSFTFLVFVSLYQLYATIPFTKVVKGGSFKM